MAITLPSAEEIDHYGTRLEPPAPDPAGIPRIADDEAVCLVHVPEMGSGAYWSRGDVDVPLLYTKQQNQHGSADGLAHLTPQVSLAQALRERRQLRQRLLRYGVQTTATGLVLL